MLSTWMSRTRNKSSTDTAAAFGRKNRLIRCKLGLEIGDRVRIVDISPDLKDPGYDAKDAEHREMRTAELFRFCLGRGFTVRGFGRFATVELEAGANRAVRQEFGHYHKIWIEPGFLKRVRKRKRGSTKIGRKQ